jgi:hypothetical protein
MDSIYLVAIVLLGGVGVLLVQRRRLRRLRITQEDMRCPLHDCRARLAVQTDTTAHPWRRYVDVTACSLLPSMSFVPPARAACFSDMSACEPYFYDITPSPRHSAEVACPKHCLYALTAADAGVSAAPIRCTSGISDGLELVRQTQNPRITQLLWFHSA